jgi:hypothetical protein
MSSSTQTFSFSEFAEELLQVYQSRVAQDWVDGLVFMSTAGGRVDLLKKVQDRASAFLALDSPQPSYTGAAIEAVVGEFGSGKSHIGFLLKYHFISCAPKTLVIHCQMTGDRSIGEVWSRALQNLWLSEKSSRLSSGVEMSAYDEVKAIFAKEPATAASAKVAQTVRKYLRKLDPAFATDFATALLSPNASLLSEFLTVWVAKEEPLVANEALQAILGVFTTLGIAGRVVFLLDEVEALESLDRKEQLMAVQSFQDMHDDFAFRVPGLPAIYWVFLSTTKFWETGRELLPSFFGERDRTRVISTIPPIEKVEVYSLADRYALLLQLTGRIKRPLSSEQLLAAADSAWEQLLSEGRQWHMRSIHSIILERVTLQGK